MEKIQDIIKELESYGLTREEIINRLKCKCQYKNLGKCQS